MAEPGFGLDSIMSIIWMPIMLFLMFYGQRIQAYLVLRKIGGSLNKLETMKVDARTKVITALSEFNSDKSIVEKRLDRLLMSFMIAPISLDPRGMVQKLEHLINTQEHALRADLRLIAKPADDDQLSTLENLVEVALGLNLMFKIIRHFYISGKKTGSAMILAQVQMLLPQIMEQAEAYHAAIPSLMSGKPIGDGMGPLIASRLAGKSKAREIVDNTIVNEASLDGRQLLLVRAKGPGGRVGKPGEAIKRLLDENKDISLIVTVDAALKFEGESTGEIAEGIGAAIGGPGVERYKIEAVSTERSVPMIAIVVKMSEKDAITSMGKKLLDASNLLMQRLKDMIVSHSKKGDKIIVAGIGNTLGVP